MLTELYAKWDMVKVDVMMHYVSKKLSLANRL